MNAYAYNAVAIAAGVLPNRRMQRANHNHQSPTYMALIIKFHV